MDHNLGDTLNLEGSMGAEFVNADEMVVSEGVISMDSAGHDGDIPMEFEHMTEQQMMMDTGNEEIIDFMGDQIQLSEFSIEDNSHTTIPLEAEQSSFLTAESETIMDIQLAQTVPSTSYIIQPEISKLAPVQNNSSPQKKHDQYVITTVSRQVPIKPKPHYTVKAPPKIAPKPPPPTPIALLANRSQIMKLGSISQQKPPLKHYAIAPKPDVKFVGTLMSNATVKQGAQKAQPVLAQIGKQLVMLPSKTGQKFKLVTSANASGNISIRNDGELAQLISRKSVTSQDGKPIKFIVQGQQNVDPPAMLTKIITSSGTVTSGPPQNYITVQSKKVPITPGMMIQSPKRNFVKLNKKQMISLSPSKIYPSGTPGSPKKIILSEAQAQNLLKTGSSIHIGGAKTQIHQINVPGKGVQYIRLVTNPATQAKTQQAVVSKGKTYVFADNTGAIKNQKLVRIAPLNSKTGQMFVRSSQSLLAPISQASEVSVESKNLQAEPTSNIKIEMIDNERVEEQLVDNLEGEEIEYQEMDDRTHSLSTLMENTVREEEPQQEEDDSRSSEVENRSNEAPLIVVPPDYHINDKPIVPDVDDAHYTDDKRLNVEMVDYQSDSEHLQEIIPSGLDMRPRKACNCTKSQCLKLYCDCFANGEFCNRCNCINCHNNLENEELRQKAIRGCLDRNPNAFRPKIGKTKSGGPEIVRRHNKGCNCKRSGCLKNYCECFEAKIACSAMCKCVGCRNVQECVSRRLAAAHRNQPANCAQSLTHKQPCSFMTSEVIEAVCQCLIASASETNSHSPTDEDDPIRDVIDEFARCLQDIIDHARNEAPSDLLLERC